MQFLATSSINRSTFNFNSNYLILGLQQLRVNFISIVILNGNKMKRSVLLSWVEGRQLAAKPSRGKPMQNGLIESFNDWLWMNC